MVSYFFFVDKFIICKKRETKEHYSFLHQYIIIFRIHEEKNNSNYNIQNILLYRLLSYTQENYDE